MAKTDKMSTIERYRLRKLVERLKSMRGHATQLISLYIPYDRSIDLVRSYIEKEKSTAINIKSRLTRKNVLACLEKILQTLKKMDRIPENGLIIFCGAIPRSGPGTEVIEKYVIEPPEQNKIFLYRCGNEFYVEPLKNMLEEKKVYGLISMDNDSCTFGLLKGNEIITLKTITSGVPRKHRAGGQSARRFQRIREGKIIEFYKRIAEHAKELFGDKKLDGILIGGPGPAKETFYRQGYLPSDLSRKVLGVIDTAYTEEEGLRDLVKRGINLLKESEYAHEERVMNELLETVSKKPELVEFGVDRIISMMKQGMVRKLIVSEELDKIMLYKVRCQKCGHEWVLRLDVSKKIKLSQQKCPKCGGAMLTSREMGTLLEHLINLAEEMYVDVEIISSTSEVGQQLIKSFGGLAALLYYALEQ